MALYPDAYPVIEDWDALTASLLPDIAANGSGLAMFRALVAPLEQIDSSLSALYAGLVEIEDAAGGVLDLRGDLTGEPRQGMSDQEYRRIIAGRLVAQSGGVTVPKVYAGWSALTGSSAATLDELGTSSIRLVAPIDFTPSDLWLSRAGDVVRDLMGAGYQATAMVTVPSTAIFGAPTTPFGLGRWAYQLRVLGAS